MSWLIIISHLKTQLSSQTYIHFLWLEWTVDILNSFKQFASSLSYLPKQINQNNNKGSLRKPSESLTDFNWNELYKLHDIWTRVLLTSLAVFSDRRLQRITHQHIPHPHPIERRLPVLLQREAPRVKECLVFTSWCFIGNTSLVWAHLQCNHEFFKGIKRKTESMWTSLDLPWKGYFLLLLIETMPGTFVLPPQIHHWSHYPFVQFSLHTDDQFLLEFSSRKKKILLMTSMLSFYQRII